MKAVPWKAWLMALLVAAPVVTPAAAKDLLIIGQDYPPFNWMDAGTVKGGMVDVLRKACEKLKFNCKFSIVPLARGMPMLEDGSADAVMSLIPNAERAVYAQFSPTLVVQNMGYFALKGKAKPMTSLSDLSGWTVGAVRGSASLRMAREHQKQVKDLVLVEEVSNETLINKLLGERYGDKGAVMSGDAVLGFNARRAHVALEMLWSAEPQGFTTAFSKKSVDAQTFADITKTLEAMKKSGELKALLDKYALKSE